MSVLSSATPITLSDLSNGLKEYYDGQMVAEIVFDQRARPLLSKLSKKEITGNYYPVPWIGTFSQGGSNVFSKAQENVKTGVFKTPKVSVKEYHQVRQLNTKAMRAAGNTKGAYFDAALIKTREILNELGNDIERSLFKSQYGVRATVGTKTTVTASTTFNLTLTKSSDCRNFEIGMEVVNLASVTNSTTSLASKVAEVTAVDYINGTITISGTSIAASTFGAGRYILREGDRTVQANPWISGLPDWIPTSVSSGESFYGVDRSSNRQRLAGTYDTGSLEDIEAGIMSLTSKMQSAYTTFPSLALCSWDLANRLAKEMNEARWRTPTDGRGGQANTYMVRGATSMLEVMPCTFCPDNEVYVLTPETWQIISYGPVVALWEHDGLVARAVYNDAAVEFRACSYPNLICTNPGANGRIVFS